MTSAGAIDLRSPVNRSCPLTAGMTSWFLHGVVGRGPPILGGTSWRDAGGRTTALSVLDTLTRVTDTTSTGKPGLVGAVQLFTSVCFGGGSAVDADRFFPAADRGSVLLVQRHRDTNLRTANTFGVNTDGASMVNRANAYAPYADSSVYWDWGGDTEGTTRLKFAYAKDTAWHWWAFTVGGGFGMRVYRDGVLLASNAASPSRALGSGAVWWVGRDVSFTADLADVAEVATFDRALAPDQVWGWMDQSRRGHPDTLLRVSHRPRGFKAAAGGGGGPTPAAAVDLSGTGLLMGW